MVVNSGSIYKMPKQQVSFTQTTLIYTKCLQTVFRDSLEINVLLEFYCRFMFKDLFVEFVTYFG